MAKKHNDAMTRLVHEAVRISTHAILNSPAAVTEPKKQKTASVCEPGPSKCFVSTKYGNWTPSKSGLEIDSKRVKKSQKNVKTVKKVGESQSPSANVLKKWVEKAKNQKLKTSTPAKASEVIVAGDPVGLGASFANKNEAQKPSRQVLVNVENPGPNTQKHRLTVLDSNSSDDRTLKPLTVP